MPSIHPSIHLSSPVPPSLLPLPLRPLLTPSTPFKKTNRYLADEHQDKKKAPLDMSDWELVPSNPDVTPQQGNGSDCGCFASAFAYLMSEGIPFKHVRNVT